MAVRQSSDILHSFSSGSIRNQSQSDEEYHFCDPCQGKRAVTGVMDSGNMEKRRQAIVDITNQIGEIRFPQLRNFFPGVSDVTLRKDLSYLDGKQQLIRIHGGAKSMPHATNYAFRSELHLEEKMLIADKALGLIKANDSVYISSGTTCTELASRLPDIPLYVITDGLNTASRLPCSPNIKVEIFGGEVDLNIMRVIGPSVLEELNSRRFNIAFMGTPGFHPDYGFSCLSANVAAIFRRVIEQSDRVVILMDSSKVNYSYAPNILPMDAVDTVVSDGKLEPGIISCMEKAGITVL